MTLHSIAVHTRRIGASRWVGMLSLGLLFAACQKDPPKPTPPPPAPAAPAAPAPVAKAKPAAAPRPAMTPLEWDDPPAWKRVTPSSPMRQASYEIPAAKGDKLPGELNVFVLGGDVQANIQRWVDEFSGFDQKTVVHFDRTVNDMQQAIVEVPKGKFSGGMGDGAPSDNFGLLGAIVVTPQGAEYFFKLTGPSATVKKARDPFYKMLDGMRLQGSAAAAKTDVPAAKAGTPAAKADAPAAKTSTGAPAAATKPEPAAKPAAASATPAK